MATGTAKHGSPQPQPAREPRRNGRVVEYQQYIDTQLGRTRRRVKWVDLWTGLTMLAVGFVAYLLVAAVIDHWIVPGGLGTIGRWLLLVGLVAGVAIQSVLGIGPLIIRRVNPVYAAAAIEQGGRMKNTLINFLLLRRQPEGVPEGVLEAIKEQAAVRLSNVPEDAPVDRTGLIRWCYVLAAILIAALGYAFASPKDSFRSIRRVMTPWANLSAPTRVRFESIEPGNVDRHRDDIVEVKVRAAGMRAHDAVTLFYSATGNPADDIALPMQADESRYLWKVVLPPGSEGLKQDLFYYVQAGDAASPPFRIRVLSTPVINVRSVRYDYPAYTGLPPRTVDKQGDLKALEGTHVTLTAEANQAIAAAHVAFDQTRAKDVELKPAALEAVGGFDLLLKKDRETPVHTSYVLRFTNIDGQENPKPVEHRIEVMADQPPEVRITEPTTPPEKEIALPVGGILRVTLAARDPDFQLGDLAVVVERNGGVIREERILSGTRYGDYSNTAILSAEALKLKAGDKFTFRGRAADNKTPKPNVVETPRYTVVITPPNGAQQPNNQQNQNPPPNQPQQQQNNPQQNNAGKQPNEQRPQQGNDQNKQPPQNGQQPNPGEKQNPNDRNDGQPGEKRDGQPGEGQGNQNGGEKRPGEQKPGERSQGGNDQQPNEQKQNEPPPDPNVDPGKVIEELNKHFEQQDKKNEPQQKPKQPNEQNGGSPEQKQDQGAGQKNQESGGGQQKPNGDQGSGNEKQPGGGEKSGNQPKDDGSTGGGSKGEQGGEKQPGPDGGKSGDERKAGGAEGVGRQGSEGGGDKNPGGKANNEPAKNPGNNAAQPGGEQGTKTNDPSQQNPADRKPGANDGGREAGKKPGDDKTQGADNATKQANDPNDRMQQGSGGQQQGKPNDNAGGKQPGENKPGEKPEGAKPGEGQEQAERRPGEKTNAGQPGVKRDTNSQDSGSGSQAGGEESKPQDQGKRPGEQNPDGTQGKPSVNEKQPAGNEKNPGGKDGPAPGNEGSPDQEERAKPRDKTGKPGSDNQTKPGEKEKSPGSNSKHESDAQGQSSGDRSGKGEEGGGQKSNQKGTGSAGENTPGDQGGGTAPQEGDQAASDKGGDKVRGNDPSQGKPSERTGEGSKTENGGDKAGGEKSGSSKSNEAANQGSGEQQTGAGQGGEKNAGRPGEKRPPNNDEAQSNKGPNGPGGGGDPNANRESTPPDAQTVAPPADAANLDYTRQVTDLTLDRLKQQLDKGEIDPKVLEMFGSKENAAEWYRKWDAWRQAARDPSPTAEPARKQFQETLKSLGLRPKATSQQGATSGGDDPRFQRGARRSEPPAKYADQYRAYTTGVGQGEK